MKTTYTVFGNKKQGYRICVPTKAKTSDHYECIPIEVKALYMLKPGDLVYGPKVEP